MYSILHFVPFFFSQLHVKLTYTNIETNSISLFQYNSQLVSIYLNGSEMTLGTNVLLAFDISFSNRKFKTTLGTSSN